nr:hypothetical protein SHINE37_20024 [Rhizobiaceae bacterium]
MLTLAYPTRIAIQMFLKVVGHIAFCDNRFYNSFEKIPSRHSRGVTACAMACSKTLVYDKRSMETNYVSDGRIFATWSREPYASKIGRSPILSPLYGILRELRRRYQRMRSARPLPCSSRRNAPTTSNLADMTPSNVDVL